MEKSDGKTIRVPIATPGNSVESTWMTWESSVFESVTGYDSHGIFPLLDRL